MARIVAGLFEDQPAADAAIARLREANGIIVAVNADNEPERLAVEVLRDAGARMVEIEDGDWADGRWRDFDALNPPRNVVATRGNPDYPT